MTKADPKGTPTRTVFVCSCEGTMPIDGAAIATGCPGARVERADHLCRVELERFRAALTGTPTGAPVTVACTQEAPLFGELARETPGAGPIDFINIRETAGWSVDAAASGPKMAALLAAAAEPMPEPPLHSLTSEGVVLILGRDAAAIEAGTLLAPHLDVAVMLRDLRDTAPPHATVFPVVQGRVRQASGHLGAFELTIDRYAPPAPSSRAALMPGPARDGATSRCDIVLDLTGETALFPVALRDGYLRADPGDPAAVLRAVLQARDLVGTFDKPRYVAFTDALCAHSRSRIVGCRRCLDLCPAGAIASAGDHVAIDPSLCAGCG
ncbi:MAG: 4Fe-4S ferredoxin, partial [Alphaproteobacteria bacterium]|nr:4Fe-4S ferredoxin [Alphaproteobacteria bacterium]